MVKAINSVVASEVEKRTVSDVLGGDRARSAVFRINYIRYQYSRNSLYPQKDKLDDNKKQVALPQKKKTGKMMENDATYIFSCDDPSEHFVQKGDITSSILNANNELTMHDKNFANQIFKKFMSSMTSIVSKLDQMYRKG